MRLLYSIVLVTIVLGGCVTPKDDYPGTEFSPQMYHSVAYEPLKQVKDKKIGMWMTVSEDKDEHSEFYNSNPLNVSEMNMREPVAGTVKRSKALPYRYAKDEITVAAAELSNPTDSTADVVAAGKKLYSRYCWHCHGDNGQGDGPVGKVFKGVTPYNSRAVKDKPGGHIYHVITMGKGRMGSHASQVSPEDRWRIVRYVQTLQKQ